MKKVNRVINKQRKESKPGKINSFVVQEEVESAKNKSDQEADNYTKLDHLRM